MNSLITGASKIRFLIILFIGVVSGTLFANFQADVLLKLNIFNRNYAEDIITTTVNYMDLWSYVLKSRIMDVIFLVLVGFTSIYLLIYMVYTYIIGIEIGMMLSLAIMHNGILGIGIFVSSIFPHFVLYGFGIYMLFKMVYQLKNSEYAYGRNMKQVLATGLALILVILLGTYLEAFLNLWILRGTLIKIL